MKIEKIERMTFNQLMSAYEIAEQEGNTDLMTLICTELQARRGARFA